MNRLGQVPPNHGVAMNRLGQVPPNRGVAIADLVRYPAKECITPRYEERTTQSNAQQDEEKSPE